MTAHGPRISQRTTDRPLEMLANNTLVHKTLEWHPTLGLPNESRRTDGPVAISQPAARACPDGNPRPQNEAALFMQPAVHLAIAVSAKDGRQPSARRSEHRTKPSAFLKRMH